MKRVLLLVTLIVTLVASVGCSASRSASMSAPMSAESPMMGAPADAGAADAAASDGAVNNLQVAAMPQAAADDAAVAASSVANQELPATSSANLGNRKIIRNGYLRIEADAVIQALNAATRLSTQVGGYVVSSRSWTGADDLPYASLSFAVPVERFEHALEQTRLLGEVQDENVSSQDVTGQFYDLESRITNLEATAERLRSFLNDAKKVDEALDVNRELSNIEGQLEVLKGQRNALSQQTSFSTVTIDFVPVPPVVTTGEVLEKAHVWSPLATFNNALEVLLGLARVGADFLIWLIVIGTPALIVLLILWLIARRLFGVRRAVGVS
ncbi:MAG: DUF4349 domain-containing protein [Caldilineaceae bacterium]|nr:DUF4349 domain-containing protein [Caldilineaceae bacterium]